MGITTVPATSFAKMKARPEPTTGSVCCFDTENGSFWPLWSHRNEPAECGDRPRWAIGAYLKVSKSECCNAFFRLQVERCLEETSQKTNYVEITFFLPKFLSSKIRFWS